MLLRLGCGFCTTSPISLRSSSPRATAAPAVLVGDEVELHVVVVVGVRDQAALLECSLKVLPSTLVSAVQSPAGAFCRMKFFGVPFGLL